MKNSLIIGVVFFSVIFLTGCGIFRSNGGEGRPQNDHGQQLRPVTMEGLKLTKISEGFVSRLYHDVAGHCTIGYGHLVKMGSCDRSVPRGFRDGISTSEGEYLLKKDMNAAKRVVMREVSVPLSDAQYSALVDFVYNVGPTHFRNSTLLKRLNAGRYRDVPVQLRRWVYAGGKRLEGLKIRREREIALYHNALRIRGDRILVGYEAVDQDLFSIADQEKLPPIDILTGEAVE